MNTQSFRHALAGVAVIGAITLCAVAEGSEGIGEHFAADAGRASAREQKVQAMEEVVVVGTRMMPHSDRARLEADLHEQTRALTERLNAAIERELKELVAPKLEIRVAGV